MKPTPWKCSCEAGSLGPVSHSAFAVTCATCGEVAPWFPVSRPEQGEDAQATEGTEE